MVGNRKSDSVANLKQTVLSSNRRGHLCDFSRKLRDSLPCSLLSMILTRSSKFYEIYGLNLDNIYEIMNKSNNSYLMLSSFCLIFFVLKNEILFK